MGDSHHVTMSPHVTQVKFGSLTRLLVERMLNLFLSSTIQKHDALRKVNFRVLILGTICMLTMCLNHRTGTVASEREKKRSRPVSHWQARWQLHHSLLRPTMKLLHPSPSEFFYAMVSCEFDFTLS